MLSTNTTTTRTGGAASGSDLLFAVLLGTIGFVTVGIWSTGQLAGLLFNQTWPHTSLGDAVSIAFALPHHWSDPRQAWPPVARDALPGAVGCYTATVLVLAVLGAGAWLVLRRLGRGRQHRGFASPAQLADTLSHRAALANRARLRPDLPTKQATIVDVAVDLGRATGSGMRLAATIDNSVLVLAAPRQGKTSQVVVPWLRDWPGPALVTSVRSDVLDNTLTLRQLCGPVAVIDFTDEGWPYRLRWSPLSGCDRYDKARARAEVMVRVGKDATNDSTNAGFFGLTATNLLAGWMHTAALTGRTMDDVLRWALHEGDDEPIGLLAGSDRAHPHVAAMLEGIYASPTETRSNMWATVMTAVAPLVADTARHAFCPPAADSFDIEAFLHGNGTVYILVAEKDAADLAPLLSAFVDEVTTVAKRLAERAVTGRLSPPLGLILDEVANVVPLPNLPALMSYAGGSGIFVTAVLQSLAQARHRWGQDGADMLWSAATVKIALGGLTGDELNDLSRLAGRYRETIHAVQRGPGGYTTTPSLTDRDTISPDEIRTLSARRREALIIHATTRAVTTRMVRHYEGPHAKAHAAAVDAARQLRRPHGSSR